MKPFRYTAKQFREWGYGAKEAEILTERVNGELEAHEAKCEMVWGAMEYDTGVMVYFDDKDAWSDEPTHTALLWNVVQLVRECICGEINARHCPVHNETVKEGE